MSDSLPSRSDRPGFLAGFLAVEAPSVDTAGCAGRPKAFDDHLLFTASS
ncbi:hypothetical protein [Streptomyces sp. NPDC096193]